jgi:hypothetical protein
MAYSNITIATPSQWKPLMMAGVKTLVEANGWTTVENAYNDGTYTRWAFTPASGAFTVVFFTFTASLNTLTYNLTQFNNASVYPAQLYMTVCESYNATTHLLTRPLLARTSLASAADHSAGYSIYHLRSTRCLVVHAFLLLHVDRNNTCYW